MIRAILDGIILGLTLALLIGPAFFTLIQTSIKHGFNSGVALAIGIFISDTTCVFLAYLGASQLFDNPENKVIIGVIGGIIMIIFGTVNVFHKPAAQDDGVEIKSRSPFWMMVKGYILNILNPFVLLFWIGAVTLESSKFEFDIPKVVACFSVTLLTVLATDFLKAYIALKIRELLSPGLLLKVNRVAGIILIVVGMSLIYRVIF